MKLINNYCMRRNNVVYTGWIQYVPPNWEVVDLAISVFVDHEWQKPIPIQDESIKEQFKRDFFAKNGESH